MKKYIYNITIILAASLGCLNTGFASNTGNVWSSQSIPADNQYLSGNYIAMDANSNIYYFEKNKSDPRTDGIYKIPFTASTNSYGSPSQVTLFRTSTKYAGPIVVDSTGQHIYMVDKKIVDVPHAPPYDVFSIQECSNCTANSSPWLPIGPSDGSLGNISSLAVDTAGTVYVGSYSDAVSANVVYQITAGQKTAKQIATFVTLSGLAAYTPGTVYVTGLQTESFNLSLGDGPYGYENVYSISTSTPPVASTPKQIGVVGNSDDPNLSFYGGITVDKDNNLYFVSLLGNYWTTSLFELPWNSESKTYGNLKTIGSYIQQDHPQGVAVNPTQPDRIAFLNADQGSSPSIFQFAKAAPTAFIVDPTTNAINHCKIDTKGTFTGCASTNATNVSGPTAIAFNTVGTWAFIINKTTHTVSYCTIDINTGTSPTTNPITGGPSCGPSNATEITNPTAIALNAAGTLAYITNGSGIAGSDTSPMVTKCNIDTYERGDGAFTQCSPANATSVTAPTAITFNAAGTIAFITNGSGTIPVTHCSVDPKSGTFTPSSCASSGATNVTAPTAITFNATDTMAFITNGSGTIPVTHCTVDAKGNFIPSSCASSNATSVTAPTAIALNTAGTLAFITNGSGTIPVTQCTVDAKGAFTGCASTGGTIGNTSSDILLVNAA